MQKATKWLVIIMLLGISFFSRAQGGDSPQQREVRKYFADYFRTDIAPEREKVLNEHLSKILTRKNKKSISPRDMLLFLQENSVSQSNLDSYVKNNPALDMLNKGNIEEQYFFQVMNWHNFAIELTANDHTSFKDPNGNTLQIKQEQLGPARTSRAMAIFHMAVFEAINAAYGKYKTYHAIRDSIFKKGNLPATITVTQVSVQHAVSYAAHDALTSLYPSKKPEIEDFLRKSTGRIIAKPQALQYGIAVGQLAAQFVLADRMHDNADLADPPSISYTVSDPSVYGLRWEQDPLNPLPPVALGGLWSRVSPFVLVKSEQFRPAMPPPFYSPEFNKAFSEVCLKGVDDMASQRLPGRSDRASIPTNRTAEEEFIGKFWAYDGTAYLCAPPRLYNMIVTSLVLKEKRADFQGEFAALELARLLARVNVAMADAGIAAWEAKYYYLYPRPVHTIRATKPGTVPGLDANLPWALWAPLGAPITNGESNKVNFTPPFPSYPSGHATFGGALFQILRRYWGDNIGFDFVSDEYNGLNHDPGAKAYRPEKTVHLTSFTQAESLNAISRVYLGIHWRFDADAGVKQGKEVGDYVFDNLYK